MRLVSYNVQYCTGKDGRADIDRIVAEIENADVILRSALIEAGIPLRAA